MFVVVGLRFVLRRTSSENQLANQAFAAYWTGLGLYTGIAGMLDVAAAFGFAPFPQERRRPVRRLRLPTAAGVHRGPPGPRKPARRARAPRGAAHLTSE